MAVEAVAGRSGRHWPIWIFLPVSLAATYALGPLVERGLTGIALAASLAAAALPGARRMLGAFALILLLSVTISLAARLVGDDFAYHYVWLLSAPELAWYLKLANLWAGDEGTLLGLGLVGLALAHALARGDGWAGPGAYLVAAVFILGALIWDPFRQTAPDLLATLPSRGMNAHLVSFWMTVHPPLVFLATMLLLAPVGAAIQALAGRGGGWSAISGRYSRGAWLILSAGIAFGMWWAYEDFAYGTVWHWDPVQTSSFVVWCFLTGQLHAQRQYRSDGAFRVVHPLLGIAAAIAIVLSMVVTRSPVLASSHRYLGETSLPLLVVLSAVLGAATLVALVMRIRLRVVWRRPAGEREVLIWIAIALFAGAGLIALGQIAHAYGSAYLGLPRPEDLKPFFEILARFAHGGEIDSLRAAFAQWDIDNFATNRWLTPIGIIIGLVGGHYFLPLRRRWRWIVSGAVVVLALAIAWGLAPFAGFYEGTGLTSSKTVAILPWLDVLLITLTYLTVAIAAWVVDAIGREGGRRSYRYYGPVALIHVGAMLVVGAGLVATVFDSYAQRIVKVPDDLDAALLFPGGYTLRLGVTENERIADGARSGNAAEAFRAIARVEWSLSRDGRVVESQQGHTVYRDERPPYSNEIGPVRLMCEMIDYRYARYASADRQMIHPFISRGLWRDVQVWFPAVSYRRGVAASDGSGEPSRDPAGSAPMVLKVIPAMTWLWIGLVMVIAGFALLYAFEWRRSPRPTPAGG